MCTKFDVNQTKLKRVIPPVSSLNSSGDLRSNVGLTSADVRTDATTKSTDRESGGYAAMHSLQVLDMYLNIQVWGTCMSGMYIVTVTLSKIRQRLLFLFLYSSLPRPVHSRQRVSRKDSQSLISPLNKQPPFSRVPILQGQTHKGMGM